MKSLSDEWDTQTALNLSRMRFILLYITTFLNFSLHKQKPLTISARGHTFVYKLLSGGTNTGTQLCAWG